MKAPSRRLVLVLLLLVILAGCVPGPNLLKATAGDGDRVAGFWLGLWQGLVAPFVMVASVVNHNLNIYEVHNSGGWYNFGYLLGLACFFRGSGKGGGAVNIRHRNGRQKGVAQS